MKTICLFSLVCIALISCSSNRVAHNDEERKAFNLVAEGKAGQIEFDSHFRVESEQIRIAEKHVTCNDKSGNSYQYSLDSIKVITLKLNRGKTGMKAVGIVLGVSVIGGVILLNLPNDNEEGLEPGGKFVYAFIQGVLISPFAFLAGYWMGENVHYTFE